MSPNPYAYTNAALTLECERPNRDLLVRATGEDAWPAIADMRRTAHELGLRADFAGGEPTQTRPAGAEIRLRVRGSVGDLRELWDAVQSARGRTDRELPAGFGKRPALVSEDELADIEDRGWRSDQGARFGRGVDEHDRDVKR